jgi:EAL domain-containing protein (putative c-di-GMP-specific phosphodiesterase class I)
VDRVDGLSLSNVKIDKSFIDGIDHDPAAETLIRGIIDTAHAYQLTVTAEGVERSAQLAVLRRLDCDHAQGFFIHRPATAGNVASALPNR